jgi:hypothetical protein
MEASREHRRECLPFPGQHLGDLAVMHGDAGD